MSRLASIEVFRSEYMDGPEESKPKPVTIRTWCERWEREKEDGVPWHKRRGLPSVHLQGGYFVLVDHLGIEPANQKGSREEPAEEEQQGDPGSAALRRITG
ncbi:MAG TPA: hypothetical protein VKA48_07065 [Gammaproteobacteria bacterium]|nr:hypothetical protein [Gammaproteobacteria bacterium]